MVMLGGKFLTYIGLGTLVFGYIYGEFAGFEFCLISRRNTLLKQHVVTIGTMAIASRTPTCWKRGTCPHGCLG